MRFFLINVMAALLFAPLQQFPRDPLKEMQKRSEKDATEKNYKELKDAAAELAELSVKLGPPGCGWFNTF